MCRPAIAPLCQFCHQPLPPVTMAHTAAGIAPIHVCRFDHTAGAPIVIPNATVHLFAAAATAAPFAGQIIPWNPA